MRRLLPLSLLLCLTGCPEPSLNLSDYDRSCAFNTDCVLVGLSPCGACDCPSIGIAQTSKEAHQRDYDAAVCGPRDDVVCGPCAPDLPSCEAGVCTTRPIPPTVTATDYDQSCTTDEDCVAVFEGDVCDECKCANATVSKAAQMDYNLAFTMNQCGSPPPCAADCALPVPTCQNGTCSL